MIVVPFFRPLIFKVTSLVFDVIFATLLFVYLLLIVETLPLILTTAILPFFTFTVVFESLGAVVTVTLQDSFLPVVNVAVTDEVPLLIM